jgi:hypothetical protein
LAKPVEECDDFLNDNFIRNNVLTINPFTKKNSESVHQRVAYIIEYNEAYL